MRQATFLRKKVRISEKDYKRLLNRFNPKKLKIGREREVKCPLCEKFLVRAVAVACVGCPFYKFVKEGVRGAGCSILINRLVKSFKMVPNLAPYTIRAATKKELKGVEKIHKILLTRFERI